MFDFTTFKFMQHSIVVCIQAKSLQLEIMGQRLSRKDLHFPKNIYSNIRIYFFNPIHCQRFPNSFTARGVGDQHPLKTFLLVSTSHFNYIDLMAQWQSISKSFFWSLLQILIYSRHRRFESYSRQIFFIYLLNNILYYYHFFTNIGVQLVWIPKNL